MSSAVKPCVYLDHNATTRVLPEVAEVISRHSQESFANPGSRHAAGRRARRVLEDARDTLARILDAESEEVVFTSGGTESINAAIFGLAGSAPGTIALTEGEHPATLEACRHLAQQGFRLHWLPVDGDGRLRPEAWEALPWPELRLVSVILAHNETGVIQDLLPLAARCQAHGVPVHVDAVQAVGKIPVSFRGLGVTALSLGAHKFYGPRGVGGLLIRQGVRMKPWLFGGHQERDRRPGTEPVPLIAGMVRALELWEQDAAVRQQRMRSLRDHFERELRARYDFVTINGGAAPRLPNTSQVAFRGLDGDALLVALDLEGVCCSLGSTCASGASEPAPVLRAMGCPADVIRGSVRFSLGIDTTPEEIDDALERIATVVDRVRDGERSRGATSAPHPS